MVDVLNTGKWNPEQCLLEAGKACADMEVCAVVYIQKGEEHPRLTTSSMKPTDMNFLGLALQQYSLKYIRDD